MTDPGEPIEGVVLKPCPLCGGPVQAYEEVPYEIAERVSCDRCRYDFVASGVSGSVSRIVALWNALPRTRRLRAEALKSRIEGE